MGDDVLGYCIGLIKLIEIDRNISFDWFI